jgi:hypothetical protein
VREKHREAAAPQVLRSSQEILAEPPKRHLEQHPAPPGRPVREDLELAVAEGVNGVRLHLSPAVDRELNALACEGLCELAHPVGQLGHLHELDVRGRHDALRTVASGSERVLEAFLERVRAVVDAWEQVAVQVDHGT